MLRAVLQAWAQDEIDMVRKGERGGGGRATKLEGPEKTRSRRSSMRVEIGRYLPWGTDVSAEQNGRQTTQRQVTHRLVRSGTTSQTTRRRGRRRRYSCETRSVGWVTTTTVKSNDGPGSEGINYQRVHTVPEPEVGCDFWCPRLALTAAGIEPQEGCSGGCWWLGLPRRGC